MPEKTPPSPCQEHIVWVRFFSKWFTTEGILSMRSRLAPQVHEVLLLGTQPLFALIPTSGLESRVIIFGLDLAWAIDLGDRTGKRQMDYRKSLLVSFWGKDYTLNHFPPASEKNMDSGIRKN
jgi:hypothetical protein